MRSLRCFTFCLCLATASTAHAGKMYFGWLYDTDVLQQRGVELETWVTEENQVRGRDSTLFWWAPIVGVTDRIELAVPVALEYERDAAGQSSFGFHRFGLEGRFRLTNPDPVEGSPFGFLIRAAAFRLVDQRSTGRFELGVVMSLDVKRVRIGLDVEGVVEAGPQAVSAEVEPGLGVSVRIYDEFRLGAEVAASLELNGSDPERWVAVGPNLSWTYGRFWVSGAFLIGLREIVTAPRINFGIAF